MLTTLFGLLWWGVVLAASYQAWRAWGKGPAIGTTIGLYLLTTLLPALVGGILTLGIAVVIGARAEGAQQRLLSLYR